MLKKNFKIIGKLKDDSRSGDLNDIDSFSTHLPEVTSDMQNDWESKGIDFNTGPNITRFFDYFMMKLSLFLNLMAQLQTLKEMYVEGENGETQVKKAIMGALKLYLDFLNLFIMLLMLLGNRR